MLKSFKIPVLSRKHQVVWGSFCIIISITLLFSFISFFSSWQYDQSNLEGIYVNEGEIKNIMQKFGSIVSDLFIYRGIGFSAFLIVFMFMLTGVYYFFDIKKNSIWRKWFWTIIFSIWFSVFFAIILPNYPISSGVIGYELFEILNLYIGVYGIGGLLIFVLICFFVFQLDWVPEKLKNLSPVSKKNQNENKDEISEEIDGISEENDNTNNEVLLEPNLNIEKKKAKESKIQNTEKDEKNSNLQLSVVDSYEDELLKKSKKLVDDFGEFDPTLELKNFKSPTESLLINYQHEGITINESELEENKDKIIDTLKNYQIGIADIKATIGPTVTLYEIVPAAGVRISKIKNLEDDIALSLSALGIRIIAPIPGKGTVGIEVPNKKSTIVSMKSVILSKKFQEAEMELPLALGKTISNETYVVDLSKMPHLLMAGATGQGKSVGLNVIITSLLYKKHPAEIKFILVDPKKVELTLFNKIERHYLAKLPNVSEAIITDNKQVINTLNSLCIEMDKRYDLLKIAMCRNIKEYNAKFKERKLNPDNGHAFLPYLVLVIDEFADLIMTTGKEVETPIARLAQLARAVGIHLVIATQRPSVNVITGLIKANFPARIAFRVMSKVDSRTILDNSGADQLIGRGDMLFNQGNALTRLQCAFVDTPEIERITDFIGSQRAYANAHELPEYTADEKTINKENIISERDSMFKEAAEVVVNAQQGSASLLQRKLKLGYNRAGRIIDQLEAAGIVGPFEGSKAREVMFRDIISLHEFLENES